jgi:hypothetical protein
MTLTFQILISSAFIITFESYKIPVTSTAEIASLNKLRFNPTYRVLLCQPGDFHGNQKVPFTRSVTSNSALSGGAMTVRDKTKSEIIFIEVQNKIERNAE